MAVVSKCVGGAFVLAAAGVWWCAASARQHDCPPSVFRDPAPGNTAALPVPRGPWSDGLARNWFPQHQRHAKAAATGSISLLFLGDSITEGWGRPGQAVWQRHFAVLDGAHFGIGGDQTQHLLWRIEHGELDGLAPDSVVLLIGTNNLYTNTAAEIAEGIAVILREIRTRTPRSHVLLMGVLPRGRAPEAPERAKICELNALLSGYADCAITYLDIGAQFLNPDGSLRIDLMPDGLHPSAAGYELWAQAVKSWFYAH